MNESQNNKYLVPQGMPAPDADAIEHSQKLSALIKQEIGKKKRIPFSRFMELALYAQGLGYYSAGSTKLGESGDFITAPEISPLFSRCIAKQCEQVLSELDSKYILEFGAGSGKMAADILLELERDNCLPKQYYILETSAELRQQQQNTLQTRAAHLAPLVQWLDTLPENGFSGVIIGLSGGVDSALTLAIAVDALGAENVQAGMMPSRYTADISLQDAEAEANLLGVKYDVITIEHVFNSFLTSLAPVFKDAPIDTTEENIQARCRGLLLMAISNKTGRMVLTTGNKSEMAVGYATLYGDMCGGFAPIKDVYKTLVYQLCRYRNSLSAVIPERVLTRPPTAELRENQCDQDSLPDYEVLDRILELSVEQDKPIDEIVAQGINRKTARQGISLVQSSEHKSRQSAPGIRITRRAFGRDRRYPITSGYRRK